MKQLQNNFTTPEQSKRLLELGVPAESADTTITKHVHYDHSTYTNRSFWAHTMINFKGNPDAEKYLPCWSVGRLNEIFKICSDNHIEIYDLDLEGTQIERAMQAFENYAKYNWLDFSKLED